MPPADRFAHRVTAYVAPFVLYVVPTMFEAKEWLGLPYEIVYTVKVLLTAAALWRFRRDYPAISPAGVWAGVAAGCLGCAIWIGLARLQSQIPGFQQLIESVLQGGRPGYDPFSNDRPAAFRTAFVLIRLIGLVIVVPVMEEIFWRGFLARYLISDDFPTVPQGAFTPFSFAVVTLAFASVHPEILAALVWGAAINLLYRRTANLWACVAMHAVTNGLLGAYILSTGNWQLW